MQGRKRLAAIAAAAVVLAAAPAADAKRADTFEVTFTDLTSGQPLTPAVAATHRGKNELFRVGRAASFGLKEIAENGNNAPMLNRLLIGATFVGPDVADLLQAATVAIIGRVPLRTLAHAVAPFPARSELWLKFIEAYERRRDQHGLDGSLHAEPSGPVAVAA